MKLAPSRGLALDPLLCQRVSAAFFPRRERTRYVGLLFIKITVAAALADGFTAIPHDPSELNPKSPVQPPLNYLFWLFGKIGGAL